MIATVKRILWIATTPIAFSLLLAAPVRASQEPAEPAGGAGQHAEAAAEHHVSKNPIHNWFDFIGYRSKDTDGGKYEPDQGDHRMPAPFGGALINFGLFAFIIGKMFGGSFKKLVQDRHDGIAKQLAESARLRSEAAARLAEYTRKVENLDAEIAALVDGIRREAEADKARILSEAEKNAARMRKDAEQQIQAEIARARVTLEREAVETAMNIARQILTEKATDADHRAMAEKFIKELGAAPRRAS
jgi:F-type H+-transporting ATPase subunit b